MTDAAVWIEKLELQPHPEGGFYRFEGGRPVRQKSFPQPDSDLVDRLILMLVNEAAACYSEGIVDDVDLLDAGVVFGTGFAPFTGGPIHYARACGKDALIARLERQAARHGARFRPHPAWEDIFGSK